MKKNIIGAIAALGLLASSCHRETPPDPCAGVKATSADFKIEEVIFGAKYENGVAKEWYRHFEMTDTTYSCQSLKFTANEELEAYFWQIGADTTIHRSRTFNLDMGCATGPVTVRLIGKRRPDTSCNPSDDGIDTVTKTIFLVNKWSDLPIFGRYEGYFENNPQKLERISFYMDSTYHPGRLYAATENVPAGSGQNIAQLYGTYALYMTPGYNNSSYNQYGWWVTYLQNGKRYIDVDFSYWGPTDTIRIRTKFKGVKYEDL